MSATNVMEEQDTLWGFDEGRIYDLVNHFRCKSHHLASQDLSLQTFDNVVIGGKKLDSQDHFITNEFVYDLRFVN